MTLKVTDNQYGRLFKRQLGFLSFLYFGVWLHTQTSTSEKLPDQPSQTVHSGMSKCRDQCHWFIT